MISKLLDFSATLEKHDALNKYAGGIFIAKVGSEELSDLGEDPCCARNDNR